MKVYVSRIEEEEYDLIMRDRIALKYLGYGREEPDELMKEAFFSRKEAIKRCMKPRFCYGVLRVLDTSENIVCLSGLAEEEELPTELRMIQSASLARHLNGYEYAVCAALTLGDEVDSEIEKCQEESMLDALLTDAVANACVEGVREQLEQCVKAQMESEYSAVGANFVFGIGYGDTNLSLQPHFLRFLQTEKNIALSCNKNCVLVPMKSVTGFLGIGRKQKKADDSGDGRAECGKESCSECGQKDCVKYGQNGTDL